MASSSWDSSTSGTKNVVAGYFISGDDAHRAINELMDEGFQASQIGAAFHSGTGVDNPRRSVPVGSDFSVGSKEGSSENDIPMRSPVEPGSTPSGAASDTSAVNPSGLSTGGGTGIAGAGRPGPIPGSDIPGNLPTNIPSDIPSELASDTYNRAFAGTGSGRTEGGNFPATGGFHATRAERRDATRDNGSWWDKLKHFFGDQTTDASAKRQPVSDKSSLNYGTGEGHLGTYPDYAYSGTAFERSFSGMGIPQDHARRLSRELRRGGAVVTVKAGSMNSTAEAIMERNHGIIRYESASAADQDIWDKDNQDARVEIFGEVHRVYPGYVPADNARDRKAS